MKRIKGSTDFQGLKISLEFLAGDKRKWKDDSGKEGSTTMKYPYGYILKTRGTDGDHVDVYVGPDTTSDKVFVIDQNKKDNWAVFDEQKCMLGFNTEAQAKKAYLDHYNDARFFRSIKTLKMDEFKDKVLGKKFRGRKLAHARLLPPADFHTRVKALTP